MADLLSYLTCDYSQEFMNAYVDLDMSIGAEYGFDMFKDNTFAIYCMASI